VGKLISNAQVTELASRDVDIVWNEITLGISPGLLEAECLETRMGLSSSFWNSSSSRLLLKENLESDGLVKNFITSLESFGKLSMDGLANDRVGR
jgi:hypothetical protein